MKKVRAFGILLCLTVLLAGCTIKESKLSKLKDLDFTVVDEDDIPAEMMTRIEEGKDKPLKITYADKGALYIGEGYGTKDTSGYSIEVTDCYETENAIYIHTNLLGPSKDEEVASETTYPYVVIKIEYNEKKVVFD